MRRSSENLSGLSSITTAVRVKIAADAPTNVASRGKKGMLNPKLRTPPRKNVPSIRFELVTLSKVFPKTYRNIMLPRRWIRFAWTKIEVMSVQTLPSRRFCALKARLRSTKVGFAVQL